MSVNAWELDPEFKYEVASTPGGENIMRCFQCSTCTASCPIADIDPNYNPRKTIRMTLLGMKNKVLSSDEIWMCAICQMCTERCPQDVRISDVMGAIRQVAEKEAEKGNIDIKSVRPTFEKAFMHQIEKYGRSYEIGLTMEYYQKVHKGFVSAMMAMQKDYTKLGMRLFKKGKMPVTSVLPEKIKRTDEVKKIFKSIGD